MIHHHLTINQLRFFFFFFFSNDESHDNSNDVERTNINISFSDFDDSSGDFGSVESIYNPANSFDDDFFGFSSVHELCWLWSEDDSICISVGSEPGRGISFELTKN